MKPKDITIDDLVDQSSKQRRSRPSREKGLDPDDPRHGTTNGYNNFGCRCELCRAAWNAYTKDYRRRKPEASRRANLAYYHRRKERERGSIGTDKEHDVWIRRFRNLYDVAEEYANLIKANGPMWDGWAQINQAIMRKWSESALRYVKEKAWEIVEEDK